MSILIKGMEMPKNCVECPLTWLTWVDDDYDAICPFTNVIALNIGRQDDCPLIELPPHGDLVDRDYLLSEYDRQHKGPAGGARRIMEDAPTIIEAERSIHEQT